MDLKWSTSDQEFRDEVRDFLAKNLTPGLRRAGQALQLMLTLVQADAAE